MSEEYIESHYSEIIGHESDIETRQIKDDCTKDGLSRCNRWFIEAFSNAGETVTIIENDYIDTIQFSQMEALI